MVFSSYVFVFVYLPVILVGYYLSPRRLQHFVLARFSYGFYGWANPAFVLLMLFSTVVDYGCGLIIGGEGPAYPETPSRARRLNRNELRAPRVLQVFQFKFVEAWENFDELAMMQQIGAIPASAQA